MTAQGNTGARLSKGPRFRQGWAKAGSMTNTHQRGIVIGPILFVVAILAVLASVIAAGSGSFSGDTSAISAKAQATAILEQAKAVKFAVDRVLGNGCKDTEISFENPIVSGYVNPSAPSDKSCHVFDVSGGGIVWETPPTTALDQVAYDSATSASKRFGNYMFSGSCVSGVGKGGPVGGYTCIGANGTTEADLILALPWVSKDVCLQINQIVGFNNYNAASPPDQTMWNAFGIYFNGYYFNSFGIAADAIHGNVNNLGAAQGCLDAKVQQGSNNYPGGGYFYFRVLIAR